MIVVLYGPQLPIDHFVAILRYQVPDSTLTQTFPYSGEYLHVEGKLLASLKWPSEPQFHFATGSQAETPYHLFSGIGIPYEIHRVTLIFLRERSQSL